LKIGPLNLFGIGDLEFGTYLGLGACYLVLREILCASVVKQKNGRKD
jgi:hypothetical protein